MSGFCLRACVCVYVCACVRVCVCVICVSQARISALESDLAAANIAVAAAQSTANAAKTTADSHSASVADIPGLKASVAGSLVSISSMQTQIDGLASAPKGALDCYNLPQAYAGCTQNPRAPIPACNAGYVLAGIVELYQSDSGCGVSSRNYQYAKGRCCRVV
jgi:hypothetical protein